MKRLRRNHSAKFKALMALEAIHAEKTSQIRSTNFNESSEL